MRQSAGSAILMASFILLGGCGSQPADSAGQAQSSSPPVVPPTAAITPSTAQPEAKSGAAIAADTSSAPGTSTASSDASASPKTINTSSAAEAPMGSGQWLIREIVRIRSAPLDVVRQPIPGKPKEFQEVQLTPEQVQAERRRRAFEVIELATQAIAKTHDQEDQRQLFNNAVHYLADARMQLALMNEPEQAQLMEEDAAALQKMYPGSFAATEAAFKLVQLAQTRAQQQGSDDPQWSIAFARQARLFSEKFPTETSRAAVSLISAGRTCENHGLLDEALACFQVVETSFPNSPFSEQIAGTLRRLRLPGETLTEFGGSTHDGGYLSIDQYRGRAIIVAFWASNSEVFRNDLPALQQLAKSVGEDNLEIIGVNLDRDEQALDHFLEATGIGWKHIFFSSAEKRGGSNPVARHYGVIRVPTYWLIDRKGVVRSIDLPIEGIDVAVQQALAQ